MPNYNKNMSRWRAHAAPLNESSADEDIPQLAINPRRREHKKPARYSDFETDDEQHSRITSALSPTRDYSGTDDSPSAAAPAAPPAATRTCFVCNLNFSEKNFAWHVSTHFQVELVADYDSGI